MSASTCPRPNQISGVDIVEDPDDENTPLLGVEVVHPQVTDNSGLENGCSGCEYSLNKKPRNARGVFGVLSLLFIGVFVSQADFSLILATYSTIASEFNEFRNASWLLSSFMLAMCMAQPLYGKMSDIFGRKAVLQFSYGSFALGSLLCGFCHSIEQLIVSRAIQGFGAAGMVSLVSIIITDLVPIREVASYRSYVNVVQTAGRSSGGAIGGYLAQIVGWRWTLAGQAPLTVLAMILIAISLHIGNSQKRSGDHEDTSKPTLHTRLARVDFLGALLMSITILSFLLILDMGGEKVPWSSPLILICAGVGVAGGFLFVLAERSWAKEPIFPLHLLSNRNVLNPYLIALLQIGSQSALMFILPLYFQITKNATPGEAGAYMVPSIAGNTIGGLLTGWGIKRYGRYKPATLFAGASSTFCFALLLIFWNGDTPIWQSLFVFFAGFGTGIAHSSVFVALAAGVEDNDMAVASSGLYLSTSVGAVVGLSSSSAVFQAVLTPALHDALVGKVPDAEETIKRALSDIVYVQNLTGKIHELVIGAYLHAFRASFVLCIAFTGVGFLAAIFLKEKRLH